MLPTKVCIFVDELLIDSEAFFKFPVRSEALNHGRNDLKFASLMLEMVQRYQRLLLAREELLSKPKRFLGLRNVGNLDTN